jgi:mannose-6-phosphate isomerase-like protein (cupin superfamily)
MIALGSMSNQEGETMKRLFYRALALAAVFCVAGQFAKISAQADSHAKHVFTPNAIPWGTPPPFVPAGAQLAVLEGDPTASTGDYTIRLKMPDGYRLPPHWHPLRENVTVISGTFKVGMGDVFDADKMMAVPAGSFAYLDPSMHHYAMASGEVVVEVHGMSPIQFNYINPQDDPSKK